MSDATFSTACARCAAPLEASDATVDDVVKAHEARCFVVGEIAALREPCTGTWTHAEPLLHHCSQEYGHEDNCYDYPPSRSELLDYESRVHIDAGPSRPALSVKAHPDPLDVEYDGVTLGELLSVDEAARREDRVAQLATWTWSPSQRAAVSAHWSAELRSRVAASSERERLTVVAPDLELETANCKDAE